MVKGMGGGCWCRFCCNRVLPPAVALCHCLLWVVLPQMLLDRTRVECPSYIPR